MSPLTDPPLFGPGTMNTPWGLGSRLKVVELASDFFDHRNHRACCAAVGRVPRTGATLVPFTLNEFLKYLDVKRAFQRTPNAFRVLQIVQRMVSSGLLICTARGDSAIPALEDRYVYLVTPQDAQRAPFRWVPVLGPEYMYRLCTPALVHITGTTAQCCAVAGTGLVVDPRHVLTCRHVVSDMNVHPKQVFQRREYVVTDGSIHRHPELDVAVIRVDRPSLTPVTGAFWRPPVVAQTVYTLGYPKLPGLRDASVTMQPGTVTNESVTSFNGESMFLYSAISRPGNSGGPVMSDDGYVVGLSIVDATGQYRTNDAFSPHYAGIPAHVVAEGVKDLGLNIELPFEHYQ
ncbi:MAG: serine protease [Chloroflexi bacterium]|nr:serine protease [Chloroflexota bacterium]